MPRKVHMFGKNLTIAQWSRELGIPYSTLYSRIECGYSQVGVVNRDYKRILNRKSPSYRGAQQTLNFKLNAREKVNANAPVETVRVSLPTGLTPIHPPAVTAPPPPPKHVCKGLDLGVLKLTIRTLLALPLNKEDQLAAIDLSLDLFHI